MSNHVTNRIITWFIENHGDWVQDGKLVSWAAKLGIKLNSNGKLDESQLFQLFVLAVLWNNKPTYHAEIGENVFREVRGFYTLKNFVNASSNTDCADALRNIAVSRVGNQYIFELLMYIANGEVNSERVLTRINHILNFPVIGNKDNDISRLKQLYQIFNPRSYKGEAYLTVKTFLIFREIRIQFRETGKYQYDPSICCIPDSNVRAALRKLDRLDKIGNTIDDLIIASQTVAEYFCKENYDLYDIPLFLWGRALRRSAKFQ